MIRSCAFNNTRVTHFSIPLIQRCVVCCARYAAETYRINTECRWVMPSILLPHLTYISHLPHVINSNKEAWHVSNLTTFVFFAAAAAARTFFLFGCRIFIPYDASTPHFKPNRFLLFLLHSSLDGSPLAHKHKYTIVLHKDKQPVTGDPFDFRRTHAQKHTHSHTHRRRKNCFQTLNSHHRYIYIYIYKVVMLLILLCCFFALFHLATFSLHSPHLFITFGSLKI